MKNKLKRGLILKRKKTEAAELLTRTKFIPIFRNLSLPKLSDILTDPDKIFQLN